jgi:hypothetical protein
LELAASQPLPTPAPGNYSPVTVHLNDTVGAVFLGLIALGLMVALGRTQARLRALLAARA